MDTSSRWFMEQLVDCEFIHQYHFNSPGPDDQFLMVPTELEHVVQRSLSSESYSSYPTFNASLSNPKIEPSPKRPNKKLKHYETNSWASSITTDSIQSPKAAASSSPTLRILSFETTSPPDHHNVDYSEHYYGGLECAVKPKDEALSYRNFQFQTSVPEAAPYPENLQGYPLISEGTRRPFSMVRTPSQGEDHKIAERKRREKVNQRLIALSALVPGLKKMDKASVLGDAIEYVKQLQERVEVLEKQTKKRTVESVVLSKNSQLSADDESSSISDEASDGQSDSALPEIEARASDKDVLIRIHCQKQCGIVAKILDEIENLHLSIDKTSVLPFGSSILDITIIAQMDKEFSMTVKDLVKNLRLAILQVHGTN